MLTKSMWLCALALVIVGSVLPGNSSAIQHLGGFGLNDKFEHFFAYLSLSGPLPLFHKIRPKWLRASLMGLIVMGVLLEVVQSMVPGRSPDLRDALADAAGVLVGAVIGFAIKLVVSLRRQRAEA
jgi:VanZ family protein